MSASGLRRQLEQRFSRCSEEQLQQLSNYAELVRSFGSKMNLTAAKTAQEYDEIFFSDADALDQCIDRCSLRDQSPLRCVDIGAGAGAPALPISILRPDLTFTLVEPLRKRVTFLRTAVGSLGLAARVRVLEQKVDWRLPNVDGSPFDLAISRATLAPDKWLEVGQKLAPHVGLFHSSSKHPHPGLEIASEIQLKLNDGRPRFVAIFRLIDGE